MTSALVRDPSTGAKPRHTARPSSHTVASAGDSWRVTAISARTLAFTDGGVRLEGSGEGTLHVDLIGYRIVNL